MIRHPVLMRAALLAALGLAAAAPALAQDAAFAGRWVIERAEVAPWADTLHPFGPEEEQRLLGRTVAFGPRAVSGPQPLGCSPAVYSVHDDTPDLLFEGGLAGEGADGKPRDAAALARGLGMTTPTVRTLESGCSEMLYHRLTPDTVAFGLDDRIYTMRRPAGPATPAKPD